MHAITASFTFATIVKPGIIMLRRARRARLPRLLDVHVVERAFVLNAIYTWTISQPLHSGLLFNARKRRALNSTQR
jgi:hypothetical protein